jgi:hypothetical protein
MKYDVVDALISPEGKLEVLSRAEVGKLLDTSQGGLYNLFRNCSLAVLNCGSSLDDGKELLERYQSFDIRVIQEERGIKLDVKGAPEHAFVDGKIIKGISEHLFAVLRDVVYVSDEINDNPNMELNSSAGVVIPSHGMSTITARWLATKWACAAWISVPVAGPAR